MKVVGPKYRPPKLAKIRDRGRLGHGAVPHLFTIHSISNRSFEQQTQWTGEGKINLEGKANNFRLYPGFMLDLGKKKQGDYFSVTFDHL